MGNFDLKYDVTYSVIGTPRVVDREHLENIKLENKLKQLQQAAKDLGLYRCSMTGALVVGRPGLDSDERGRCVTVLYPSSGEAVNYWELDCLRVIDPEAIPAVGYFTENPKVKEWHSAEEGSRWDVYFHSSIDNEVKKVNTIVENTEEGLKFVGVNRLFTLSVNPHTIGHFVIVKEGTSPRKVK